MKKLISILLSVSIMLSYSFTVLASSTVATPTVNIDFSRQTHDILHGSAGFLYGISNEGVPEVNTLTPLKPKVLATKGALGTEHPYSDALDVADEFFEAGGEQVQMYNSNYYGVFGVTANAYDYGNVLKNTIAPHVSDWKNTMREKYPDIDSKMVYIPINEGTPVNGVSSFEAAWKIYYDSIKSSDPSAMIAGPNDAVYRGHNSMYAFLKFCRDNNCLPDIISWHELQVNCLNTMSSHIADYRSICSSLSIPEVQIVINEYADYSDCGVPGRLVNWIARLEDNQVYGCLPFWHQANNLNDLASNSNDGNGAWWVYKWYGDMSGKTLSVSTQNTTFDNFYAVASIDEAKQSATVLAGGNDNTGIINLNNITSSSVFKNCDKVHIKVEAAYFTGYHGSSGEPESVLEGVFLVENGNVSIQLDDMLFSTAYRITVTKTDEQSAYVLKGKYRAAYEAEDAIHYGNLIVESESSPLETPRYFCSGRVRVGGFDEDGDGICYNISVPHDGLYKLSFIYGNGVGSTRNNSATHAPKNITQSLFIDNREDTLILANTLFYSMEGMCDKYVNLTAGSHSIKIMYSGDAGAFHDCLYVSYVGAMDSDVPVFDKTFESESADFNPHSLSVTESTSSDYSGNGYVTNLSVIPVENGGGIRHIVHVPSSGLYNILFRYKSSSDGSIRIFSDNTNLTFSNYLTSINISPSDAWQECYTTIFLKKGLNIIDCDMTCEGLLDYMRIINSGCDFSICCEAEDAYGNFSTQTNGECEYVLPLPASSHAYSEDGKFLELSVSVSQSGLYKMQVFQSNDELCGTHSYNIKIIDRYASFAVNGDYENAERYFFPNSFSADTFLEKTIPLNLRQGENKIRIYNDDSWHVLWGGSKSEPGENILENFTPNFDKFIITPAVVDAPLFETGCKIDISSSDNGYIYSDKNYASYGEDVTLYLIPDGYIKSLTLNGKDLLPLLSTQDGNIYTVTFAAEDCARIMCEFTKAYGDDFSASSYDYIYIDGNCYRKIGTNLYDNHDFSDNSGYGMSQWFTGVNTNGHPSSTSYAVPTINPDSTIENLIPLTESDFLTVGSFESDFQNTFYFGKDNSRTYLVEHMHSDWKMCSWNGKASLLSYVPIKPDTNYIFSFDSYSVSGKASVRFGAINSQSYVPPIYDENSSLNFTSDNYFDCTNGNMQNVGGKWTTHTLSFNSGKDANYFFFNAYWLQMCEYLCIGNFNLYELSSTPLAKLKNVKSPPAQIVVRDTQFTLPKSIIAEKDDSTPITLAVNWLNSEIVDASTPGVYLVTGKIDCPDGYFLEDEHVRIRVIVTDNRCEITSLSVSPSSTQLFITGYCNLQASVIVSPSSSDCPVYIFPFTVSQNETVEITVPYFENSNIFIWNMPSLRPVCEKKFIR